jgi:Ran GTPase-activating protein (RanGAP) involved in mRNA processing and transport
MSNPLNFDQLVKRKCIDLSFNGLHDANIDVLVDVIQKTTELHSLNLWGNRIALDDDKLTDAIAENSTIRVLSLGSNSIESEGGKRLAAALKINTSIVELHLGDNRIADEGAALLADALASNGTIGILGAYGNGIGDEGAKSLAASFASNKSLRRVWLHENRFGEEGSRKIVDAVRKNCDIESIFLLNKYDSDIKAILEDPARKEKAREAAEAEAEAAAEEEEKARVVDEANLIQKNKQLLEELSSKIAEIAMLKAVLELRDEELKAKNEEITSLKAAALEKSTTKATSIKKHTKVPFDDVRDEMDVVGDDIALLPALSVE